MPRSVLFQALLFITLALAGMLVVLAWSGAVFQLPGWLQVVGRMHPLLLHFPLVLFILSILVEIFIGLKQSKSRIITGDWLLLLSSFTAIIAAFMGWLLSNEEGYDAEAIKWHKWSGVAVAVLAVLWLVLRHSIRKSKLAAFAMAVPCLLLLVVAGHKGAEITHGTDYLFEPVLKETVTQQVAFDDALAFDHLIRPILDAKCISCHNTSKAKGQLIMETRETLLKGGKNGKLWDTSAAGFGLMMDRVHLPMDDKKHMPPSGKPQLTPAEILVLHEWIKRGSPMDLKLADLPPNDSLRLASQPFFQNTIEEVYDFAAADEAQVEKLNNDYRVIKPLAINSPALSIAFYGASQYSTKLLKELEPVKDNIVELNLARMPLSKADVDFVSTLKNLRVLNLSFSNLKDEDIRPLSNLPELKQLTLSGNAVTPSGLNALSSSKKLKTIYLWNTGITSQQVASLHRSNAGKAFVLGYNSDTSFPKLSMPVIEGDQQLFTDSIKVSLRKLMGGIEVRYTLDGSEPDSIKSSRYIKPFFIKESSTIKLKAWMKGWQPSDITSRDYLLAKYKPVKTELVLPPDVAYSGDGAKTLFDGVIGTKNFRTNWLGYKENDMEVLMELPRQSVSKLTVRSLIDVGSYIMPARQILVYGGTSRDNLSLLGSASPQQPATTVLAYFEKYDFSFKNTYPLYIKVVAKTVNKLPLWHPGRGQKGWFFIDEIILH